MLLNFEMLLKYISDGSLPSLSYQTAHLRISLFKKAANFAKKNVYFIGLFRRCVESGFLHNLQ